MPRGPIHSGGNVGSVWGPMKAGYFDGSKLVQNALRKKSEDWKKKRINHSFIIAINTCDIEYSSNYDEINAIYPDEVLINRHPMVGNDAFDKYLSCVAWILVFNKVTLGREEIAAVRLFKNPRHTIPKCLGFLEQEPK